MILTLEVTGPQAQALGSGRRKVFGTEGGTIGRLPDNDWVLADPYVSGRHAIIRFVDGVFCIEDNSRNGIFVNGSSDRLVRGHAHAIKSGDRILIDPYEIDVQVDAQPGDFAVGGSAADDPFVFPIAEESEFPSPALSPLPSDPIRGLGLDAKVVQSSKGPAGADLEEGSPLWEHYAPPSMEPPSSELIPPNWQDSGPSIAIPPPLNQRPAVPAPVLRQAQKPQPAAPGRQPAAAGGPGVAALLEAAGMVDVSAVSPELAGELGQILRVVVSGVMDVLKARQRTKDEFGLGVTTFKRADNNPLKFSADVDHALQNLFAKKPAAAYLGPVEAFEDAFEDMRNHQIAMLVGVRVAFEAMLSEFHPDHLQEQFDRQLKKGALVSMPAKLRYWELYRDWIHDMVRDADTSFRELFGNEFARAYEEQLKRLKAQGRAGQP
jgi:type VI secretion system FHA domain protein